MIYILYLFIVGSYAIALVSINYYNLLNQYFGLLYSNISYKVLSANWSGLKEELQKPLNQELASVLADAKFSLQLPAQAPVSISASVESDLIEMEEDDAIKFPSLAMLELVYIAQADVIPESRLKTLGDIEMAFAPASKRARLEAKQGASLEAEAEEGDEDEDEDEDMVGSLENLAVGAN